MSQVKLTPKLLKRIIDEEVAKFGDMEDVEKRAKDTEETEADEYADALEKHIDYVKALKIEEGRCHEDANAVKAKMSTLALRNGKRMTGPTGAGAFAGSAVGSNVSLRRQANGSAQKALCGV
jgi:hypothetical protein